MTDHDAVTGMHEGCGLEFSLTRADLERMFDQQKGLCFWLGIPLVASLDKRGPQRPSVDRLDNSRGYTADNVVLACMFANMGRSTLSVEKMREFSNWLRQWYATSSETILPDPPQ